MMELREVSEGRAQATVVEARLDRGQGAVATVIVNKGRLRVGDAVVVGIEYGKVSGWLGVGQSEWPGVGLSEV